MNLKTFMKMGIVCELGDFGISNVINNFKNKRIWLTREIFVVFRIIDVVLKVVIYEGHKTYFYKRVNYRMIVKMRSFTCKINKLFYLFHSCPSH
jgi:hypothetical protein